MIIVLNFADILGFIFKALMVVVCLFGVVLFFGLFGYSYRKVAIWCIRQMDKLSHHNSLVKGLITTLLSIAMMLLIAFSFYLIG
ncbi:MULTISPECIES: hypothetical protein [unclassified Klebsiella]|uniref:hypothetical protein n=1 Tax=unclassified Klebsiella TaxID=2608929 RepID=UPI00141A0A79|nr:hypothetical protein [Klebsiella sp. Ap-874]NIG47620.1 hypothetical protein [Klebsiella sp. Ap-874]NIG72853.1 hypothetical protein [Klebsiella sp. Ap-873]